MLVQYRVYNALRCAHDLCNCCFAVDVLLMTITSKEHYDEEYFDAIARRQFRRSNDESGVQRQLHGILAGGNRSHTLQSLSMPVVVIHGSQDPLIPCGTCRRRRSAPWVC